MTEDISTEPESSADEIYSTLEGLFSEGNNPNSKTRGWVRGLAEVCGGYTKDFLNSSSPSMDIYTQSGEGGGSNVLMSLPGKLFHAHLVGREQIDEFTYNVWATSNGTYTGPHFGRRSAYSLITAVLSIGAGVLIGEAVEDPYLIDQIGSVGFTAIFTMIGCGIHYRKIKNKIINRFKDLKGPARLVEGMEALERVVLETKEAGSTEID